METKMVVWEQKGPQRILTSLLNSSAIQIENAWS